MKIHYDDAVDALYIALSVETPHGAVELTDGINVDPTSDGHIAGIEILNASTRIDLKANIMDALRCHTDRCHQAVADRCVMT